MSKLDVDTLDAHKQANSTHPAIRTGSIDYVFLYYWFKWSGSS